MSQNSWHLFAVRHASSLECCFYCHMLTFFYRFLIFLLLSLFLLFACRLWCDSLCGNVIQVSFNYCLENRLSVLFKDLIRDCLWSAICIALESKPRAPLTIWHTTWWVLTRSYVNRTWTRATDTLQGYLCLASRHLKSIEANTSHTQLCL
jgi:hypothetical protein